MMVAISTVVPSRSPAVGWADDQLCLPLSGGGPSRRNTPPPKKPASFSQALRELRRVGCAHAQGDALRAMYADLLASRMRGADPARFYAYLADKGDLIEAYKKLCLDVGAYTDALLTDP